MRPSRAERRRGFALLLVLALVPVLALGGYAFAHLMRAEVRAARLAAREAQVRWLADAGVQHALALLLDKTRMIPGEYELHDDSSAFAGVAVPGLRRDGRFSLIAPNPDAGGEIRYGLDYEGAKIPLRSKRITLSRAALMGLPRMTEEIADKLVDWIDANDAPLEFGAESQYYGQLSPARAARNGALLTLEELLGVEGVTPDLFYGEDADRDGFQGPHEKDGLERWPPDDADDSLFRGWRHYLTVHSKAPNLNPDGLAKLNVNKDAKAAAALLTEKFSDAVAGYYALHKSKAEGQQLKALSELIDTTVKIKPTEAIAAFTAAGLDPAAMLAKFGIPPPLPQTPLNIGNLGRGGSPLPQPMEEPDVDVPSPWKAAEAGDYLETLLLWFAIDDEATLVGVVDPAWAPGAVLKCLPGVGDDAAGKIAEAGKQHRKDLTVAWLLTDGVLDAAAFRKLETAVAAGNQVYSVQSVGYLDDGGPIGRVAATIDASGKIPKVVSRVDLGGLPCGIAWKKLAEGARNLNP